MLIGWCCKISCELWWYE